MPVSAVWILVVLVALLVTVAVEVSRWFRLRHLPRQAERLLAQGDVAGARALLERAVASPGHGREHIPARLALGDLYRHEDRPEEAARQYQRALEAGGAAMDARTAADLRRRIADCLEALGLTERAEEERAEAERVVAEDRLADVRWHREEAARLAFLGKHSEAYEKHYKAIESVFLSDEPPMSRATLLAETAETLYEAGRYGEALDYLDRVESGEPAPRTAIVATYLRGLALRSLGRLDDAEAAFKVALGAAHARREEALAGAALCGLATLASDRGHLGDALRLLERAEREFPSGTAPQRAAVAVGIALHDGRFEDAVRIARAAADALPGGHSRSESRVGASLLLLETTARCHAGDGERASISLGVARGRLENDEKVWLPIGALVSWVAALRGQAVPPTHLHTIEQRARNVLDGGERGAADAARDALWLLGIAHLSLQNHRAAEGCLQAALAAATSPVQVAACAHLIGRCREAAGDGDGARHAHRRAADSGGETHWARLSRAYLDEERAGGR